MSIRDLLQAWNRFFFARTSPAPLCLFRIAIGLLVLISGLLLGPDLSTFYGHDAIVSIPAVKEILGGGRRFSLFFVWQSDTAMWALYGIYLVSALTLMIGFCTRFSATVLFLTLVSFHHREPLIMNSGDTLLRISTFFLALSPSGKMFSVDALCQTKQQHPIETAIWPIRLLQLQMTMIYAQAFITKLTGDTWINGTAVYYSSRLEEFFHLPLPLLFDYVWICKLLTWSSMLTEFSLFTLVWIKELRAPVLIMGFLLHVGIDWTMNIPLFEYAMVSYYVSFVSPRRVLMVVSKLRRRFRPRTTAELALPAPTDLNVNAEP